MTVDYRPMRPAEAPAVARLWSDVFDLPESSQAARLMDDPAAPEHTYVAATPDGAILATVHYQLSSRRDGAGRPLRVGEIDSVATRREARRQGHASRLLRLACAALEREGCTWALLVTTPMGRPLYEGEGWRCYAEPWVRGEVRLSAGGAPPQYTVHPFDPREAADGWGQLAAVDIAFNQRRPLTVARTSDTWRGKIARRVGEWMETEGLEVFVARQAPAEGKLCGYALVEFYPTAFQIRDLAVLPEEPEALAALVAAAARAASDRSLPTTTRLFLPREPWVEAILGRLLGDTATWGQEYGHLMARPIDRTFTGQQLDALFAAPGAIFSSVDLF